MYNKKRIFFLLNLIFLSFIVFSSMFYGPLHAQTITPPVAAVQALALKTGLNFISFTIEPDITPEQLQAQNPAIKEIYYFEAAAGSFLTLSRGELKTLSAGRGYIIESNADILINLSGQQLGTLGNIDLKAGFNLVGFSKMPEQIKFSELMNRYSEIKGLYKFNTMAGSFVSAVRNDSGEVMLLDGADPEFKAGEAVFVNLLKETKINFNETNNPITQEVIKEETIDNLGKTITANMPTGEQIMVEVAAQSEPFRYTAGIGAKPQNIAILPNVPVKRQKNVCTTWLRNNNVVSANAVYPNLKIKIPISDFCPTDNEDLIINFNNGKSNYSLTGIINGNTLEIDLSSSDLTYLALTSNNNSTLPSYMKTNLSKSQDRFILEFLIGGVIALFITEKGYLENSEHYIRPCEIYKYKSPKDWQLVDLDNQNVLTEKKSVLIVHGLLSGCKVKDGNNYVFYYDALAEQLSDNNFDVYCYNYPSFKSIIENGKTLASFIPKLSRKDKKISVVCHSMGGPVTRWALTKCNWNPEEYIDKVIMCAPVNNGTTSDKLKWLWAATEVLSFPYRTFLDTNILGPRQLVNVNDSLGGRFYAELNQPCSKTKNILCYGVLSEHDELVDLKSAGIFLPPDNQYSSKIERESYNYSSEKGIWKYFDKEQYCIIRTKYPKTDNVPNPNHDAPKGTSEGIGEIIKFLKEENVVFTLTPESRTVATGSLLDLSTITASIKFSNGTMKSVMPVWTIKSGGGTIENVEGKAIYTASLSPGTTILTASYTENGVTVSADFTVEIKSVSSNYDNKIVFSSTGLLGGQDIFLMNPDGTGVTNITNNGQYYGYNNTTPCWSVDKTKIAFARYKSSAYELCVMNPDGSNLKAYNVGGRPECISFIPDNKKIMFIVNKKIFTINIDGTGLAELIFMNLKVNKAFWVPGKQQVVFSNHDLYGGFGIFMLYLNEGRYSSITRYYLDSLSPDGQKILCHDNSGNEKIFRIDGTLISNISINGENPSWTSDGNQIIYYNKGIYIINQDGSNNRKITDFGVDPNWSSIPLNLRFIPPYVSNNSTDKIVFSSTGLLGGQDIFLMDPDGTGVTNITNNGQYYGYNNTTPCWSLDKTKIAFARYKSSAYELCVMNPDGSNLKAYNVGGRPECISFIPDNKKIMFIVNKKIFTINIDGTGLAQLVSMTAAVDKAFWVPGKQQVVFSNHDLYGGFGIFMLYLNEGRYSSITGYYLDSLSPDGQKILCHDNSGNEKIFRIDGTLISNISINGGNPSWTSDGNQIIYYNNGNDTQKGIYIINQDGSNNRKITDFGVDARRKIK